MSTPSKSKGEVQVHWEPPDLMVLAYKGVVEAAHIQEAVEQARDMSASARYYFVLLDVTKLDDMTPAARKVAVSSSDGAPVRGSAVFGASYHLRVLGTLLGRAAELLHRAQDNPLRFFDTEQQARTWLVQRRDIVAHGNR